MTGLVEHSTPLVLPQLAVARPAALMRQMARLCHLDRRRLGRTMPPTTLLLPPSEGASRHAGGVQFTRHDHAFDRSLW